MGERRAKASQLLGAALGATSGARGAPSVFSAEQAEDGDTNPTPTLKLTLTPTSTLILTLTSTLTQTLATQTLTLSKAKEGDTALKKLMRSEVLRLRRRPSAQEAIALGQHAGDEASPVAG